MSELGGLQTLVGVLGLTARQPRTLAGACAALEAAAEADGGCAAEVVRLGAVPRLVALSQDANAAVAGAAEAVLQLVAEGADAQAQQKLPLTLPLTLSLTLTLTLILPPPPPLPLALTPTLTLTLTQAQQKAARSLKAGGGVAQLVPRLKRAGGEEVPYHLTISPPHHLTTSPPHHLTTLTPPSYHLTTLPPYHLTISGGARRAAARRHRPAGPRQARPHC